MLGRRLAFRSHKPEATTFVNAQEARSKMTEAPNHHAMVGHDALRLLGAKLIAPVAALALAE